MIDPRIYRAAIVLVAIGLIVFAFSLQAQPRATSTTLVPGGFFGGAIRTAQALAHDYPDRTPGSAGDVALARHLAGVLASKQVPGFSVSTRSQVAQTAVGSRALETVIATRPGNSPGTIVIVSHRDGTGVADMSGTAVMLGLAHALSGQTLQRSVMLVSVSGQIGAAGATALAHTLAGRSVDAVLVLGNLAGATLDRPLIVPWSDGHLVAPLQLRNTVSRAVSREAGLRAGSYPIGSQIAHLAFPFTLTEQGPLVSAGIPALLLSTSGDRVTPARAALGSPARVEGLGEAVLQTVDRLDAGRRMPAPSTYLTISRMVVPEWAVRLLVLALILPIVLVTVDALARARRRGHSMLMWIAWVLAGAVPFLLALVAVLVARATGALSATPPGAVGAPGIPITGTDTAVLAIVGALILAGFVWCRTLLVRLLSRSLSGARRPESPAADGAAVALSIVMCALALAMWLVNPFSAALLAVALHLWIWLSHAEMRARRPVVLALPLIGIIPAVAVFIYYVGSYGLSPLDFFWSITLMVASGQLAGAAIFWCIALGCFASALVIALRAARAGTGVAEPVVTSRGPLGYAGPGSLGGTESALRR